MGIGSRGLAAGAILAGAAGVFALAAMAGNGGLDVLDSPLHPVAGSNLGAGGDGSVVYFVTDDDIGGDGALVAWTPSDDLVSQPQAAVGGAFEGQLSVDSRTVPVYAPGTGDVSPVRLFAMAVRSSEELSLVNGAAGIEPGGASIFITSSDLEGFFLPATGLFFFEGFDEFNLTSPSISLKTRITYGRVHGKSGDVPVAAEVEDVSIAFAGNLTGSVDNSDGNSEIFLTVRSDSQDAVVGDGVDPGPRQITHTVADDLDIALGREIGCFTPALNRRGEIAFVSNADITGDNPDHVQQLFLWRRGTTRQVTHSDHGAIGTPRWSADGRVLAVDATADLVRDNPDESSEIFVLRSGRLRQITGGTTGGSTSPSVSQKGNRVAFLTNADLPGAEVPTLAPEVVVTDNQGRHLFQVTSTTDGNLDEDEGTIVANELPVLSANEDGAMTVTFVSSSNIDGRNSNNLRRIWRVRVPFGLGTR